MQFKLAKSHRYWWPVTVRIPDPGNAGQYLEQELKLQFEPLPRSEQIEASEKAASLKTWREIADFEIAQAIRVIRNWDGVVDDSGSLVPFTAEALTAALQHDWFRTAATAALNASMNGEEARKGN